MSLSAQWRKQCMVRTDLEFLNAGTLGPTLRCAFDAAHDALTRWMTDAPGASLDLRSARGYLNMMEEQDKCRRVVADWLGVAPDSVALLGNATDGINAALHSIQWQPGDRIVTTNEEHEALRQPLERLQHRYGVAVDVVPFPQTDAEVARFGDDLNSKLTDRTRLVALSEVSHATGVRVSVPDIATTLAAFPQVWLLVDGSHAAGTSEELIQPRVDFYVFPAHKWLFGPVETGVLWVSQRALQRTSPLLAGAPMMSAEGVRFDDDAGAWRYEYGTRDWSKLVGLSVAIRFRQQWPEAVLVDHYATLGAAFAQGFEFASGRRLTGVAPLYSVATVNSNAIANDLWEQHRVLVKPQANNIRISIPPWLEPDRARELGRLLGHVVR